MTAALTDRAQSFGHLFVDRIEKTPNREAFRYRGGDNWKSLTWKQTKDRVFDIAAGLIALGVQPEQRVAIAATTRIEWILADLAISAPAPRPPRSIPATAREDVALHPVRLRVRGAVRRGRRARSTKVKAADLSGLRGHRAVRRPTADVHGTSVLTLARAGAARARAAAPSSRRGRRPDRRARPGAPGHADLHLGHHRPAQGRAAAPRQLGLRGRRRSTPSTSCGPDDLQYLWLPLSHVFGKVLLAAQMRSRLRHRGGRRRRQDRGEPGRDQADLHGAVPRASSRRSRAKVTLTAQRRRRAQGQDLRLGVRRRRKASRDPAGRAQRPGCCSSCSARSPTSWCSARSATGSAAGSGSSSPAPPRCPPRSPSASTPPA